MSASDDSPDKLREYQIKQLFEGLERLGVEMREGFAEIKRLLDARLESRDEKIKEIDGRVSNLELWRARMQGILLLLGAVSGAVLTIGVQRLFG